MGSKSRTELECDLRLAVEAKIAAEDKLAGLQSIPLSEELAGPDATYVELQDQIGDIEYTQTKVQNELDESLAIVDDIDTLNEELSETNTLIVSLASQIDENESTLVTMQGRIDEIKAAYDVHMEEIQIANLNYENTALLERRLHVMEAEFNKIVDEMVALREATVSLDVQLAEATDAYESVSYILEDAEERLELIPDLETQLAELKESAVEKHQMFEEHRESIETQATDLENLNEATEELQAAIESYASEIESIKEQLANIKDPTPVVNDDLEKLLVKINDATDYDDIYALGEDFNKMGLLIGQTTNGRAILCKVKDNKPVVENVLGDYVFIGDPNDYFEQFTDGVVSKIYDFVRESVGSECKSECVEQPIMVVNEDKQFAIDRLVNEAR